VYAFFPGTLGVNFIRQYQQAGLAKTVPLLTVRHAGRHLAAGAQGLGARHGHTHFWAPDTDNAVSRAFVEAFEKKYGRIPSNNAAQGYDSALLLDVAIGKVKGNVADKPAFMAALKAGSTKSVRGTLRFGNNNFPSTTGMPSRWPRTPGPREPEDGGTALKNHQDAYHTQCTMK
jgi:branched-chain amino acid transport system substrate-binding protein